MIFISISNIPFRFSDNEDMKLPMDCSVMNHKNIVCNVEYEDIVDDGRIYYSA